MGSKTDTTRWTPVATFGSASVARTTFSEVGAVGGEGYTSDPSMGMQCLRVFAEANSNTGSATVEVVITEPVSGTETVVFSDTATVTPTAQRTGMDGASGNYLCTVVFTQTSRDTVDLMGHGKDDTKVKIGVTALTTITSLKLRVSTSRDH